jgi:Zn-dependent metalloprotease
MLKKSTLLAGLFFSCFGAFSQTNPLAEALNKQADKLLFEPGSNDLQFLKFKPGVHLQAKAFPAWLRENLKQPTGTEWRELTTFEDQLGQKHIRYQQYHHNKPVEGMVFIAHIKNGEVISCNGEYKTLSTTQPQASLSTQDAYHAALNVIGATAYMWQDPAEEQLLKNITGNSAATYYPQATLVYAPTQGNFETDDFVPAYKLTIFASQPLQRVNVYLNASTGQLLFKEDLMPDAHFQGTAVTRYSGNQNLYTKKINGQYRLDEDTLGVQIHTLDMRRGTNWAGATEFTDSDNFWNNRATNSDDVAGDVHWGAEKTYLYYKNKFNRNSYNNQGGQMLSYVHFAQSFNNAFWNGQWMTYGDGDGSFMTPLTALDIVGHEFSHGVTEYSADLIYLNEAGALNESFSDIFGTAIDFQNRGASANYLIGEGVVVGGGALRSMENPGLFGDPDTYGGRNWKPLNGPDNGGVHSNSGVQNFWFYLLVNGGQGVNDIGNKYNVTGIGMAAVEKIAYRNLTVYLGPTSDYQDAATFAVESAEDIYGPCSAEAVATADAWYAVGLGAPITLRAAFVADNDYYCSIPATVGFTNSSFNATSYIWDFGDGQTSTAANPTHVYTTANVYTVTLKAFSATPVCGTVADTLIRTSYLTIRNGVTTTTACLPPIASGNRAGVGISKVIFNTISKSSADALEGNKDYACNQVTELIAGNYYDLTLETGTLPERAKAWIDYNNDGTFDPVTELAAVFNPFVNSATAVVRTSVNAVLNTPLRMRIGADYTSNANITPCGTLQRGQYEDYSVKFSAQTAIPDANFRASQNYINRGANVSFTDLSNFQPTSWEWSFPGGTPATSTAQNPTGIVYSTAGDFSVRLIVHNALGTDTITKAAYIHVSGPTGVSEARTELNKLSVFPNPATDKITIQYGFEGKKSLSLTLINTLGQEVLHRTVTAASQLATEMDVRNTASGVYYLRISDGEAMITRKLIIQKQ